MNEVRQAWTSLRSPSRTSALSASSSNNGSSTTWYDVPAPVIIHCREFREDDGIIVSNRASAAMTDSEDEARRNDVGRKEDLIEEVLYQNNVEAALNSFGKVAVESSRTSASPKDCEDSEETKNALKKRLSSTIELTATTSVKTDPDGVPTISFSFLQADERLEDVEPRIVEGKVLQDDLYDFPKSSCAVEEVSADKETVQSNSDVKDIDKISEAEETKRDSTVIVVQSDLYDVPKSSNSVEAPKERNLDINNVPITTVIDLKKRDHRLKRSSRSLKFGRRSHGGNDSDGYDPGIASMSGSYSDPECPHDALSTASERARRLKLQKRRLGKAWGRMRNWLKEEKTKIGEVVSRHARLQAVGALNDNQVGEKSEVSSKISRKCGSYDLVKARTQESGSITRVEEFGLQLASVSEERDALDIERPCSKSPDSGKASTQGHSVQGTRSTDEDRVDGSRIPNLLRNKTASSDNILGKGSRARLAPVSFSMDKLCSDVENEENDVAGREAAKGAGLIKRRMLGSIKGLMASTHLLQAHEADEGGQGGFEDVRRYVKQGGDFCKELAAILHERAELEATYAKGLSKLSSKLTKACTKDQGGNSAGGVNEAWRCVGEEMEAAAEAHRVWSIALGEQLAKPLRVGVAEAQGRSRKSIENSVDKAAKSLQEWRNIASKSKKQSFACARENERLQDLARLQSISQSQQNNNKSSNHHMTEKEASKLETRRRKAEDSSRRADTEFYTVSVRAERARLEYEGTMRKGAKQMELLEEERLSALKDLANVYLAHLQALAPRLQQSADRLTTPIRNCNVSHDVEILRNLIRRMDSNDVSNAEQLLPDFYAEHVTLAMNRERRKQALVRILHLIRQDLERERRGREGLETLHKAFIKTPAFAADESTQNVTEKLHHMRSMLLYLEAARYKVGGTLAEVEGSTRCKHPLAEHILVSRDKQGLQQSVLKIPSWAKNESLEIQDGDNELEAHLTKDHENETHRDWADRTAGDGNSENPPDEDDFSDFDEFSSHSEDNNNQEIDVASEVTAKSERTEQCRAIYQYSANLNDELSLNPGDLITVHQKQADGWWIGECRGRTGIFPATYVQVIH